MWVRLFWTNIYLLNYPLFQIWMAYLDYQVNHGGKKLNENLTSHHGVQPLSHKVLKEERNRVVVRHKAKQNKSCLKCTQYKRRRRHVSDMPLVRPWGFPWLPPGLTYRLCGLEPVERPDGSPGYPEVFKKRPWSSFPGQNSSVQRQSREGRRGKFLATRGGRRRGKSRRRRRRNSLHLCVVVLILGVKNQCVLKVILHSSKEQ